MARRPKSFARVRELPLVGRAADWGMGSIATSKQTRAAGARIAGLKATQSICPYCAVGCGQVVFLAISSAGANTVRQAEAVHLADDGIAGDAAQFLGDLAGGLTFCPHLFERLDALIGPGHRANSGFSLGGHSSCHFRMGRRVDTRAAGRFQAESGDLAPMDPTRSLGYHPTDLDGV